MRFNWKKYIPILLFIILISAAFFTRFYNLSEPPAVVFDEIYFPQFSADYLAGKYFFDIHPPHGKLLFAASFYLLNLPADIDWQALSKSQEFIESEISFKIRFLPALVGSLLIPLVYFLIFVMSRSKSAAFLSASLILLDNSFLIQSRFCLMDIILVFFSLLALLFYFLARSNLKNDFFASVLRKFLRLFCDRIFLSLNRRKTKRKTDAKDNFETTPKQYRAANQPLIYWILCGVSLGMAGGIKMTGFAVLGTLAFFEAIELLIRIFKRAELELKKKIFIFFCLIVLPFFVYYLGFAIHFQLIGGGNNLSENSGRIFSASSVQSFFYLNKQMLSANAGISQTHPFQSKWWMWLFGEKRIYYWRNIDEPAGIKNIWLAANKTLWYASEIAVLTAALFIFGLFKKIRKKFFKQFEKRRTLIILLLLCYFAFWLPLAFVNRPLFLYHYLPSISFAFMVLSLLLSDIAGKKTRYAAIGLVLIAVIWNFVSLLPISYGC